MNMEASSSSGVYTSCWKFSKRGRDNITNHDKLWFEVLTWGIRAHEDRWHQRSGKEFKGLIFEFPHAQTGFLYTAARAVRKR